MSEFNTEQAYLAAYNIHDYAIPLATVDLCIFSLIDEKLCVLTVQRTEHPFKGYWALPGGFVDVEKDQDLEATALRKLQEKTGVQTPYLEQLETVGNVTRDPRGWSLTVVYFALSPYSQIKVNTEHDSQTTWMDVESTETHQLAFDHLLLIDKAVTRLRSKVSYSTLPIHMMPEEFTLAELQHAYETIMGKKVDKKSFRRRMASADFLVETNRMKKDGGRPAKLYEIKPDLELHYYTRSV